MANNQDVVLKIRVLDPQGKFLGGKVDLRFEHTRLSDRPERRDVDASREIEIRGLRRAPEGFYKVFATLSDPFRQQGKFVSIPASGFATLDFVFDRTGQPEEPEPPRGESKVRGVVRQANGAVAPNLRVRAYDCDLRSETLLGESPTDPQGRYEIRYPPKQIVQGEVGGPDLAVKVFDANGRLLYEPDIDEILFNAPPDATVDVTIPAEVLSPPTLFEAIGKALAPALGGLRVADLQEDAQHQDLTFLARETGFDRSVLARFVIAHKLAQPSLPPEFWFALLGGSWFQYSTAQSLAAQSTAVLDLLPSLAAAPVRKALTRSFNQKEIPESLRKNIDAWVEAFLAFAASRLVSGEGKPTFVKSALDDAGITDPGKQQRFAILFNQSKALTPELLDALDKDPSFKDDEIADLSTSFRLGDLTRANFSVVKMIKDGFGVRRPENIRTLAKKSETEWVSLVTASDAAGEVELPFRADPLGGQVQVPNAEIYGRTLERQLREAFPTTAFAGGLERSLQNGGAGGLQHAVELSGFLERHESFDFLRTRVDGLEALAPEDSFTQEVKAVQRVFKLAPTFEATDTLLADNLHSAQQVYRMGESEFVRRYADRPGFTEESARLAWNRAAETQAAVLSVVVDLKGLEAEGLPAVLPGGGEALAGFPNWNNLFRAGDLCECEHCRSVLGPAAYFADLLLFLGDRETQTGHGKVQDVLFRRRPDLGFLELDCENANTALPYIDVVCEVLEDAVDASGENDLVLAGFTAIPSDPGAAREEVANAFREAFADPVNDGKEKIDPGADFSLSQVDPADLDRWVVHGEQATWLLKKKGAADFFAEILRNTKVSAEELRAYPQYVNPKAYDKLRVSRYPMTLPFDLFAEEVRAAVNKTNLQRWDLMRTLRGPAAPNDPTDGEIAAEFFGISADRDPASFDEKRLILAADPTDAGQQVAWGEAPGDGWLERVGNVKSFLQKTRLEYDELLALLDLRFINPDGDLAVHHLDDSCDLEQKVLRPLDAPKLDRLHRFLRLWRKLEGWQMWELDLVIRRIGAGTLDEPFLIHLFHVSEVRKRLGGKATVEQLCALFGDLNTETRFTRLHEKRADGLYQTLFLNRRLLRPLDSAFEVDAVDVPGPTTEKISMHRPVLVAALGIREADLAVFERFTDDNLTLKNLSLLWRHAWLSKLLKLKADEWDTVLSLIGQGELVFATPQDALDFLAAIDDVRATGFAPDELDWLLAADRSAKAATREADAARFLTALREELQAIQADHDPADLDGLRTLSENAVVQQASDELGLTPAVSRLLLTRFAVLPETLLAHLTGAFAATTGAVDYATRKTTFDGWFWATRVASLWTRWKLTLEELEQLIALPTGAQLLDVRTLPLDSAGSVASFERLARTSRLLAFRARLPETRITLLEVLGKLGAPPYPADAFASDVEGLNDAWHAADVEELVASLDIPYPVGYLLVESWERLRRAFGFLDNLNAGAATAKTFAAATMTRDHAKALQELLRSKFGAETWLGLCVEIQDVLRERKRDALAAYLLAQPEPGDAPTGTWENTNDLYAYDLLDVEMSACQLTSRLVQASGSVQLFVQRCFMGLEPHVVINADGPQADTAWRWWTWMRKYRVWEANRKVFLWPENWIEPELKKDRSPFFKDLENELLQNEINQQTVETAFANYLEKLGGVAQLEVAGFYQEDDGDETILHVFGRTTGAEPHLYYYRRYDYRQWTPWEKVDLDIQGDYLIPAVVAKRLFLFWPVFTEEPDESANRTVTTPAAESSATLPETSKLLCLQMAVSEYRQGRWTPKKISKDAFQTTPYTGEIIKSRYRFWAVDRSEVDGRFGIQFEGYSEPKHPKHSLDFFRARIDGGFELSSCRGVPELTLESLGSFVPAVRPESDSAGEATAFLKWVELVGRLDEPAEDLTLENLASFLSQHLRFVPLLLQTPGRYKLTPPWHLSYLDQLWLDGGLSPLRHLFERVPVAGTWLPFFYSDARRTFFVLPSFGGGRSIDYYPEIKKEARDLEDLFEEPVQAWLDSFPPSAWAPFAEYFHQQFPEMPPPPYTPDQLKVLAKRWLMRVFRLFISVISLLKFEFRRFHFKNFYHPFVCDFARLVANPLQGIPALMSRTTQLQDTGFSFQQVYQPQEGALAGPAGAFYPREVVDFEPDGSYASYNWELFYHAPLLIANALSRNQRFEEARDWYHFMFNPLGVESSVPGGTPMSRYWITKPFFETTRPEYVQQRIENLLRMLAGDTTVPESSSELREELERQVLDWRRNPFEPHRIASYRTVAYQKTVVMKYLDNLIAWGDSLFRQDSMESINEATQLYVLAAEILGSRPRKVPPRVKPPAESFNELESQLKGFSNALVEVENLIPLQPGAGPAGADPAPLPTLYFCIPHNEKMLGYWDTIADRLFKIRHCMNIEGVVRQLALFEPPIDPGALVKAVAAGVDISAALADLSAPLPLYRFNVLLQKANEVCNDVKALGAALLAALEKKDAEALALLRQGQEIRMLEAVRAVREKQIEEAKEALEALERSKAVVEARRNHYRDIEKIIAGEQQGLDQAERAQRHQNQAQNINITASVLGYLPNITVGASGFGGSPHATVQWGTGNIISALQAASGSESLLASVAAYQGNRASTLAGFERRFEEWKLQERLADRELLQIERSIAGAELRVEIAEKELENHRLQIENAQATDDFMRSKYTNEELYQWQVGQISGVYFQSYKLAYDLAKRAERCFRFELGLRDSSFIQFGYWDSLKKGLLSGEKLQYDVRRLEAAYLEQNRREFELTKHVSLALLDPLALVRLREAGHCFVRLPEEIFDLDYPGHYFRRIKSVSLTLPCVVGPYTTISCTLRLLKSSVRINTANGIAGYPHNRDSEGLPVEDARFVESNIPVQAMAASNAQNDSGVFELSFRDERYLPFEGAGAISDWSLELFNDAENADFGKPLRQFDYSTIADAILHIRYTAREDAGTFKNDAIQHLRDYLGEDESTHSVRLFDLRRELPSQWHRFLHPIDPAGGHVFELEMSPRLFSFRDLGKTLKVNRVWLLARCTEGSYTVVITPPSPSASSTMTLAPGDPDDPESLYGGLHVGEEDVTALDIEIVPTDPPVTWRLEMTRSDGESLQVEDVFLVLGYEWQ